MLIRKKSGIPPIDFEGLSIYDYTAGLSEKSSFAVITVPPGAEHGLSWSKRSDKYYYCTQGEVEFDMDEETITLGAGDFCLIHRGEKFDYRNVSGKAAELILVHTPNFDLDSEVFE